MIAAAARLTECTLPSITQPRRLAAWLLLALTAILTAACGGAGDEIDRALPRATTISVVPAQIRSIEVTERTVGHIVSRTAPVLTAEVGGRVTEVLADAGDAVEAGQVLLRLDPEPYELAVATARAEVARIGALLRNSRRELSRLEGLLRDGAINRSAYDALEAEVQAAEAQLEGVRTQQQLAQRNLDLTGLRAPVAGSIDQRFVSVGDFVATGGALFRLVSDDLLRIRLPFPETLADQLSVGQTVRMQRPGAEVSAAEATISELRPALAEGSRTLEVMVNVANPGGWRPGGSVAATVVVDARPSVVVPVRSVVHRPAGEVVYVVENGSVTARVVAVGWRGSEQLEILAGLEAGELIAADGAGFLSDGARVRIAGE
jgi:membrane fusion protein, multidrug efflux system